MMNLLVVLVCYSIVVKSTIDVQVNPSLLSRASTRFLSRRNTENNQSPETVNTLKLETEDFQLPDLIRNPSSQEKNLKNFLGIHVVVPVEIVPNLYMVLRIVKLADKTSVLGNNLDEKSKKIFLVECKNRDSSLKVSSCSIINSHSDTIKNVISPYQNLAASNTSVSHNGVSCTLI